MKKYIWMVSDSSSFYCVTSQFIQNLIKLFNNAYPLIHSEGVFNIVTQLFIR